MKKYAKLIITLATPNEEGKKLDLTQPFLLKNLVKCINLFNSNQQYKKNIKIASVEAKSFTIYIQIDTSQVSMTSNGRDIVALSNILRDEGWFKYSSSDKILSVESYKELDGFENEFDKLGVLPDQYKYIWTKDLSNILPDELAIQLFQSLLKLSDGKMVSELTQKKYQNATYKIKEALFEAFY